MHKINKLKNQHGGTALFMTLLVMFAMLTITLSISDLVQNGLKMHRAQINSTKAYFAAEGGAERILYEVRKVGNVFVPMFDDWCVMWNSVNALSSDYPFRPPPANAIWCDGACELNDKIQRFPSGAEFVIKYNFNAPTTSLSILGAYEDVRRKVQLDYR